MKDINKNILEIGDHVILLNETEAVTRDFEIYKVIGNGSCYAPKTMTRIEGLYSGRTDIFCTSMLKKIDINKIMKESKQ